LRPDPPSGNHPAYAQCHTWAAPTPP
jgi:hypothetical protein